MTGGRWSEGLVWLHNMEVHSGSAAGRIHHGKKVVHGNSGTEQQEQEQETERTHWKDADLQKQTAVKGTGEREENHST